LSQQISLEGAEGANLIALAVVQLYPGVWQKSRFFMPVAITVTDTSVSWQSRPWLSRRTVRGSPGGTIPTSIA